MKTALSLLIVLTYLFTVLDIQASQMVSICGCPDVPYGLSGVVDENAPEVGTRAYFTLLANQEL